MTEIARSSTRVRFLLLAGLLLALLLPQIATAATPTPFTQDFEADLGMGSVNPSPGWFDSTNLDAIRGLITRVPSGTNGITSAGGAYHAVVTDSGTTVNCIIGGAPNCYVGPISNFGGRSATWPAGGWVTQLDVYLDPAWPNGTGFELDVAPCTATASTTNGFDNCSGYVRDFILHVTKDTSTNKLWVAASNNSNYEPRQDLDTLGNNYEVTTAGWYTIVHRFRDQGGDLAVDIQLLQNGSVLFSETRTNAADDIGTVVGGSRNLWFTALSDDINLAVDNQKLCLGGDCATPTTVVVKAGNLGVDWADLDVSGGASTFVSGPATPPLGTGSLQLQTVAAPDKASIYTYAFIGTRLRDITAYGFSTYSPVNTLTPSLQLEIDPDGAGPGVPRPDSSLTNYATLVFEPYYHNTITANTWQTWDVISANAGMWATRVAGGPGGAGTISNPVTWQEFLALYPDATVSGGFGPNAGSNWLNFTGYTDNLTFGTATARTIFDMEPTPLCTTTCYVDTATGSDLNGGTSTSDAFKTIQKGVTTVQAGGSVIVAAGTYAENVTIAKSLTLDGAGDGDTAADTILEGTGRAGYGIFVNSGVTGVTIQDLRVQNFLQAPSSGIWADGGNNNFTVQNVTVNNNGFAGYSGGGVYMNGPVDNVLIDNVVAHGNRTRGIVIWNGFKSNITLTNNDVQNNNCCGIELQDGTASGVTATGNTVKNNADSGMAFTGLMAGAGPNVIANNTLVNNGRFGIEVKLANGTGLATGDGSIVIEDNNVSRTTVATDLRDYAGIAVFRRGWVAGNNNVDIPTGVIVRNNTVSGYQQNNGASSSTGFGIVVEGANMRVTGNTLNDNDVGAQVQRGHTPYAANTNTDGNQADLADDFFGRGNSPVGCATVSGNIFSGNGVDSRYVGGAGDLVVNTDTGEGFCSIQAAIDDADTLAGHTIAIPAGTFAENVTLSKQLTLDGAGSGADPATNTVIDPVSGKGIAITASGTSAAARVVVRDLRVTGATDDGITLEGTGGSYLTLDNVASVGAAGASSDGFEIKHLSPVMDVKILNSNLSGNGLSGFRMGTGTQLDGLVVEDTVFDGNQYGFLVFAANPAPTFNNISFTGVDLTNNAQKGLYTERLNNASFTDLTVTGNGSAAAAFMAGMDINLKYAAFSNISVTNSMFADNGLGDTNNQGVDLTIKVRNDGSYAGSPATLTNLTVTKVVFGGTADVAMSLGNNLDEATTAVNRNGFGGSNAAGLVVFGTPPAATINATCNWWNAADGPSGVGPGSGNAVSANADFDPWLKSSDLNGPCAINGYLFSGMAAGTTGDGVAYGSEDVLLYDLDSASWSLWWDGSAHGLTARRAVHNLDAIYVPDPSVPGSEFYLSFTQNGRAVPNISGRVDGMDVVKWDGVFSMYFDGSDVGLTNMTQEKIDALHILPGSMSPINGGACQAYLLVSTQGPGKVPNFGGGILKFGGEDVLGFCMTGSGYLTTGFWHMVLDGSAQGMPRGATENISFDATGQIMYLTTRANFNVDSAAGGHSMVYTYDFGTQTFSGPIFQAPASGLPGKVDALELAFD